VKDDGATDDLRPVCSGIIGHIVVSRFDQNAAPKASQRAGGRDDKPDGCRIASSRNVAEAALIASLRCFR
jgi:hypothetical protein